MLPTLRLPMIGLCMLAISACNSEPDLRIEDGSIITSLPDSIREVARLGTVPLQLRVTINNGAPQSTQVDNENTENIRVLVDVPANQPNDIKVEWLAFPDDTPVLLAEFINRTQPNQENLNISQLQYRSSGEDRFDVDGDERTNLQEARENRNILSIFDREVPRRFEFLDASIELTQGSMDGDTSGDAAEPDTNTTFSLRHDDVNITLYVCGQDEEPLGDGGGTDETAEQYWHDDTIFLYLDGANSDNELYDSIDDFQLGFVRATEQMIIYKGAQNQFCPENPQGGNCVTHQFDGGNNSRCDYELEVTLPIAELNMTIGNEIGFDLEITDDDNGGLREGTSGFIGFDDMSNLNADTFGTIKLLSQ